jgi:LPS sulfotransferase NodH
MSAALAPAAAPPGLYDALFGPPPDRPGVPDWDRLGIRVPYMLLMTGRCGSTWLMHLLRDTGLAGAPHEFFNEGGIAAYNAPIGARTAVGYLEGLAKRHASAGRFGFEIDAWRLFHLLPHLDFPRAFPADRAVLFWMTRRDILAQAYSFAAAKANGRWHAFAGAAAGPAAPARQPDDAAIWQEIHRILLRERRVQDFLAGQSIKAHALAYEDLVADRRLVLTRVLDLLGVPLQDALAAADATADRTERLAYDGRHALLAAFGHRHRTLLERVSAERDTLDPAVLARALADVGVAI